MKFSQENKLNSIWSEFKNGDSEAFAIIYDSQVDALYRYGTKIIDNDDLVKDAIQEVFLYLHQQRTREDFAPANLKFYLFLALKREIIKKIKKLRREDALFPEVDGFFEPEYSIEHKILDQEIKDELNQKIVDALKNLPVKQKEAVYLRFNESLDYEEISSILDITVESARKHIYRAIKTLRQIFDKDSIFLFFSSFEKKYS